MASETIPISEFKAKCLSLVEGVAASGNSIIITKHAKAVAKVTQIIAFRKSRKGSCKDLVEIKRHIVHGDSSGGWEAAR